MSRIRPVAALCALCLVLAACAPSFSVFGPVNRPYREQTLSGSAGGGKVLMISIDGLISEHGSQGFLRNRPSAVESVAAQLKIARRDKDIKALLIKVDSPGGTVTASDVIYHEIMAYKRVSGVKVVTAMMGMAASGGYYVSLPADRIYALPTTITGSVGVIFLEPRVAGLLDKIGVGVDVSKSGAQKDMGSPFRPATVEEKRLTDELVKAEAERFTGLVRERRRLSPEAMATVATARVFTAGQARKLGLVDSVGYMEDAVDEAKRLAGLPPDARVVSYRRDPAPDASYYSAGVEARQTQTALLSLGLEGLLPPRAGLYYLWTPGLAR